MQIFNYDRDLVDYLQRYAGYTATGETREQTIAICHGDGANGKSLLLTTLAAVLGEYAKSARSETLMMKRGGGVPNDIADLWGARYVNAIEMEANARLAQSLVKSLSGGDSDRTAT